MASRSYLKRHILALEKRITYWKSQVHSLETEKIQLEKDKVLFNKLHKSTDERLNSLIESAMNVKGGV